MRLASLIFFCYYCNMFKLIYYLINSDYDYLYVSVSSKGRQLTHFYLNLDNAPETYDWINEVEYINRKFGISFNIIDGRNYN